MINKPVRISVTESFKSTTGNLIGDCVNGKVEAGILEINQKVILMPHFEEVTIKNIEYHDEKIDKATVGQAVTINMTLPPGFDSQYISGGNVLCHTEYPIKFVNYFRAKI